MQDADLERMGALNFVLSTLNHQVAPLDSAARGGQARSKQGRRRRAGSYAGASYDGEARVLTLVCDDVPPPPPASSSLFFEDPVQVCVHLPSSERDPPFLYCGEGAEGSSDAVVELALEVGREVATETAAKGPVTLMDLVGRVEARTQAAAGRVWPADDPSTSLLRRRRMEERVRQRIHGEPAGAEMAVLLLTAAANSGRRNQICRPLPPSFLHDGAAVSTTPRARERRHRTQSPTSLRSPPPSMPSLPFGPSSSRPAKAAAAATAAANVVVENLGRGGLFRGDWSRFLPVQGRACCALCTGRRGRTRLRGGRYYAASLCTKSWRAGRGGEEGRGEGEGVAGREAVGREAGRQREVREGKG